MRVLLIISMTFFSVQCLLAKKTWDKDPYGWTEKDCNKVLTQSPWCTEAYKPLAFGSDAHYLLKSHWISPAIVFAELRKSQLEVGGTDESLEKKFREEMARQELDNNSLIKLRVVPFIGSGRRGSNLHSLYGGDPFFEGLNEGIKLMINNNRKKCLQPVSFEPLGQSPDEGFTVTFKDDGLITPVTKRVDLVIENGAGDFKLKFSPRKMKTSSFE